MTKLICPVCGSNKIEPRSKTMLKYWCSQCDSYISITKQYFKKYVQEATEMRSKPC